MLTEFYYNETQRAFAETRIIREKLRLEFLGTQPFSIKPEMLFEGQGIRILMIFNFFFFSQSRHIKLALPQAARASKFYWKISYVAPPRDLIKDVLLIVEKR